MLKIYFSISRHTYDTTKPPHLSMWLIYFHLFNNVRVTFNNVELIICINPCIYYELTYIFCILIIFWKSLSFLVSSLVLQINFKILELLKIINENRGMYMQYVCIKTVWKMSQIKWKYTSMMDVSTQYLHQHAMVKDWEKQWYIFWLSLTAKSSLKASTSK